MNRDVDVCNAALNNLGATTISALTEDSKAARLCNSRYTSLRDSVFRAHPWNCLITRVTLAADSADPTFEFANQFSLPTSPYCLRIVSLDYHDLVFRVEGRKILSDEATINLIYVGRVTDVTQYDTLLAETLVAKLASELAYPIIGSVSLAQNMFALYEQKLKEARFIDASEGTPASITSVTAAGSIEADTFISSRF